MTPQRLAAQIVRSLDLQQVRRILEPSCGDGSFIAAIVDRYAAEHRPGGDEQRRPLEVVGVELDAELIARCRRRFASSSATPALADCITLIKGDLFRLFLEGKGTTSTCPDVSRFNRPFDLIIGNPPFGGTFDHAIEETLDRVLGMRLGRKIKKETYSFFIVACTELLRPGGRLVFICSDTLLTIPTMTGLRHYLLETGSVALHELTEFSKETSYPILLLEYTRHGCGKIQRFGCQLDKGEIEATPNLSWGVVPETARLFRGSKLGRFLVASSGMTTGKNEYFVREIQPDNTILEPHYFRFFEARITVEYELERARLHNLSKKKRQELAEAEDRGDTERRVAVEPRDAPLVLPFPHEDYRPYNKANGQVIFSPPTHAIYWKDNGDAVLTYKRTGNWYLRGVGGQPYFGREGLTWSLVAARFLPRYLPPGYILDSGAPCAFVRKGIDSSELYFTIGWLLTPLANRVLKTVINHTRNIQSKDFERLPYPWWVSDSQKTAAIQHVRKLINMAKTGRRWDIGEREIVELSRMYAVPDDATGVKEPSQPQDLFREEAVRQPSLFSHSQPSGP